MTIFIVGGRRGEVVMEQSGLNGSEAIKFPEFSKLLTGREKFDFQLENLT